MSTCLYVYQATDHVHGHASITYVKPRRSDRDYCTRSTVHGPANPRLAKTSSCAASFDDLSSPR
jgi:hypothetical protein